MKLRQTIRKLILTPTINLSVVFLVAIGVGASGAIFSVARPLLLKALPFFKSNEIVVLYEKSPEQNRLQVSPADLEDIRSHSRTLSILSSYRFWGGTISGKGPAERVSGVKTSQEFFRLLGVYPRLGREFVGHEFMDDENVAIISHSLWQQRFDSDPNILNNQSLKIDGLPYSVVGVMPSGFNFPFSKVTTQVWLPLRLSPGELSNRKSHSLQALGRLRDGISVNNAQREISTVMSGIAKDHPDTNAHIGASLTQLKAEMSAPYSSSVFVLLAASILIVLIACLNSSALLLAKGIRQQAAVTIRKALGATDMQIIREQFYEGLLLALFGATLGVILIKFCLIFLRTWTKHMPFSDQIRIDPVIVGFAIVVAIGSAVLFSTLPALRAARIKDISSALRGGLGLRTRETRRAQAALVIVETAIAFVLIIASGLLIRTVIGIWSVPIGFNSNNVLTMNFFLPHTAYPTADRQIQFFKNVTDRMGTLSGVKGVALASPLPWEGEIGEGFQIEGAANANVPQANLVICSPTFFDVMEVPIIRGRAFSGAINKGDVEKVAIINQTMATRFWNGKNPIGQIIDVEGSGKRQIIGVAQDFHQADFMEPVQPTIFVPYSQVPTPYAGVIVRAAIDPRALTGTVRDVIASIDPDVAPTSYDTMKQTLYTAVEQQTFVMTLLTVFAVIALILATLGMYGFISQVVAMRRREFAVRMAVGASPGSVLSTVLRSGLGLVAIGSILGIAVSIFATKLLSSLLWGVRANDSVTYLSAVLVLFAVNLLALYRPAKQVLQIAPADILREQ